MMIKPTIYILLTLFTLSLSDVYLHNPQGSNNRACRAGTNRANANRLFNSQNNGRGGYACQKGKDDPKGRLTYYQGSDLIIEWTAQHGCGNPLVSCQIILQYMCGKIRDGTTTETVTQGTMNDVKYGLHENYDYYMKCKARSRNLGLFTNDRFRDVAYKPKFEGECQGNAEQKYPKAVYQDSCEEDSEKETTKHKFPEKSYQQTCTEESETKTAAEKYPEKKYEETCDQYAEKEAARRLFSMDQAPQDDANRRKWFLDQRNRHLAHYKKHCENERNHYKTRRTQLLEHFKKHCDQNRKNYLNRRNQLLTHFKTHCENHRKGVEARRLNSIKHTVEHCKRHRDHLIKRYVDTRKGHFRGATHTRQNNNGNRYGFECAEERDYYPYWHPSPWRDIAVFTDDKEECKKWVQESQNVKDKGECLSNGKSLPHVNKKDCEEGTLPFPQKGTWTITKAHGIPPPECVVSDYSKSNHLGIVGDGHEMYRYAWKIPDVEEAACTFRIRYNITTGEIKRDMDYKHNKQFKKAPVTQNPEVNYGGQKLKLNINTNQYGRVFQDRSHTFSIKKSPVPGKKIHNLNVRGKKGALVPNYPALEYDFVPNDITVNKDDYVHIQWTGSDYNAGGVDKNNIVEIKAFDLNYPNYQVAEDISKSMFNSLEQLQSFVEPKRYFDGGLVQMKKPGKYAYMCTRNNDFSNRDQKGKVNVLGNTGTATATTQSFGVDEL